MEINGNFGINANVHNMSQSKLQKTNNEVTMNQKSKVPFYTKSLANKNKKNNNKKPLHDLAAARLVKTSIFRIHCDASLCDFS